ncbi:MAG: metal-dependent transcriptional regulator [Thermoplasmata archaeon]
MVTIKNNETTVQLEDYLLIIFELEESYNIAKLTKIANILNLTPGAVNDELKRLERQRLITKVPYVGVKLTDKGLKRAVPLIRKHRIAESLIFNIFGVPWKDTHNMVKKLEHGISDDLEPYILGKLKNAETCPHGNPIPSTSRPFYLSKDPSINEIEAGRKIKVKRIVFEEPPVLEYLDSIKLRPGNIYEIVRSDKKGVAIKDVRDHDYFLDLSIAKIIKCEIL